MATYQQRGKRSRAIVRRQGKALTKTFAFNSPARGTGAVQTRHCFSLAFFASWRA
jgi:hypothetical protein